MTYEGEGHTAYNKSNACVNDAVESYLIDGTVPASDPDVLTWSTRRAKPANIDSRASRIAQARPDATPP